MTEEENSLKNLADQVKSLEHGIMLQKIIDKIVKEIEGLKSQITLTTQFADDLRKRIETLEGKGKS